jgi:hypothetical protein
MGSVTVHCTNRGSESLVAVPSFPHSRLIIKYMNKPPTNPFRRCTLSRLILTYLTALVNT